MHVTDTIFSSKSLQICVLEMYKRKPISSIQHHLAFET